MANATDVETNILTVFPGLKDDEYLSDYAAIGELLSGGAGENAVLDQLKLLESDISRVISNPSTINPLDPGASQLCEALRQLEASEGFTVPDRAPVFAGFVTHKPFREALSAGMHWEDLGAGPGHGRYTHRLQWYAIAKARITTNNVVDVFKSLGDDDKIKLPASAPSAALETAESITVWDILCDRIAIKKGAEPESDQDYRMPEKMNSWLKSDAGSELPLLSTLLQFLGKVHPENLGSRKAIDLMKVYAWTAHRKTPDQLGKNFKTAFASWAEQKGLGTVDAIVYHPDARGIRADNPVQWEESKDKKCFISTATCLSLGLPDDCSELKLLRSFRDNILLKTRLGQHDVKYYYEIAPLIVARIGKSKTPYKTYRRIYHQFICPCLNSIKNGDNLAAYSGYRKMVYHLTKTWL